MEDNFERAAQRNEEKGDKSYARELRDAGHIVRHLVRKALKRNWTISVNDSEEWTVKNATDFATIVKALFTTDSDILLFRNKGTPLGKVYLVYGNAGHEVISDYSMTLDDFMTVDIDPYVDRIEAGRD